MPIYVVKAHFDVGLGDQVEDIYVGEDRRYAYNIRQIIEDYEDPEFRCILNGAMTTFSIEVWEDGISVHKESLGLVFD